MTAFPYALFHRRSVELCLTLIVTGCAHPGEDQLESQSTERAVFMYAERIGIARLQPDGGGCLAVLDAGVLPGTRVALIEQPATDEPDTVVEGTVGSGPAVGCDQRLADPTPAGTIPSLYLISGSWSSSPTGGVATAVLEPARVIVAVGGRVQGDIDGDGTPESFRLCASSEGLHFMVWTGAPTEERLRWHRYLYAGYDLEASCSERDYAAISSFSG